jgi:hypothetical protein
MFFDIHTDSDYAFGIFKLFLYSIRLIPQTPGASGEVFHPFAPIQGFYLA